LSVTDEIKARIDIVDLVSESVPLKKAGRNYKAPCPFHQERTPSFVVFPETQTWRCFGACNEGGDVFNFVMKQNGWEFKEALEHLAERAGVELHPQTPEQAQAQAQTDRLLGLLDETAQFFNRQLNEAPEAEIAQDYVTRRALSAETVAAFQLGYAPDGWQHAINHLTDLGYAVNDIVAGGVAIRNDSGRVYDRFRHRLVIPIRDGRGRTIGFGARALRDEDNPKYLNSPQGELFDKSHTLFGLDLARREIRESETAIIVEGYMDVMQAHQAGFRNVVAQMGTALTDPQLKSLRKYADRLILALDADEAGVRATMRGLDVAREGLSDSGQAIFGGDGSMWRASRMGIDMRVIVVTEGKDPDDLIRENPDEWRRLVREAEPVSDFVIRMGMADLDPARATVFEKEKVAQRLLPLLTATESDLHREANVQKLALKLHLSERRLMEIAAESRMALAQRQSTDARRRQRRPTRAMEQAAQQWRRPQPPPPDVARSRPAVDSALPREPARDPDAMAPPPEDFLADEALADDGLLDIGLSEAPAPGLAWEEGPRPADDALIPVPDDEMDDVVLPPPDDAPPLAPEPMARIARPAPTYQPEPASSQAGYMLALLLRKPELLYQANRGLREVAESVQERFEDNARKVKLYQALSPLSADDFRDTGHRAIYTALVEALNQDGMEPLEYVREAVGQPFQEQLDTLYALLKPDEVILPPDLQRELRSIYKDMRKQGRILKEPEDELLIKTYTLRQDRLRRTNEELRFVALEADLAERQPYQDTIDANLAAIYYLEQALYQIQTG
jgi:DNA primase